MALPDDNDATDSLLSLAKRHFKKRRYAAAAELLEAYVARRPSHGHAWWRLGIALQEIGRTPAARQSLRIALRLSKNHRGLVALQLALLHKERGRRARAEKWFARSASAPDTRDRDCVWVLRGGNFARWGKLGRAAACHRHAIKLRGRNADEARLNMGYVLRAQGDYARSAREFRLALSISRDYPEAEKGLRSLEGLERAQKLLTESRSHGARDEHSPGVGDRLHELLTQAIQYRDSDQEAAASELLGEYLVHRPNDARAWWMYGNALRIIGRFSEARRALTTAFRLTSDHKGVVAVQFAMLYEAIGKRAIAEKWYAFAATDPESARFDWIPFLRGSNFLASGKFERATECFTAAIAMRGDDAAAAHVGLGRVYVAGGRYDDATAEFQAALRVKPWNSEATKSVDSLQGVREAVLMIERMRNEC